MGANWEDDGPRFPDMTRVYAAELRTRLRSAAAKKGIKLEEGVYMMFSGPCYETPAEVRLARNPGRRRGRNVNCAGSDRLRALRDSGDWNLLHYQLWCRNSGTAANHKEVVETAA